MERTKRKTKSRDIKTLAPTPTPWTLPWPGYACHSLVRVLPGSRNHSSLSCFFWSGEGNGPPTSAGCFRTLNHQQVILSLFESLVQCSSYNPLGMPSHTKQVTNWKQWFLFGGFCFVLELRSLISRKYLNNCEVLKSGNTIIV